MTLYQFKALDEHEQHDTVCDEGVFIDNRREGRYAFALYQIDALC
jgi:hypothetical protein